MTASSPTPDGSVATADVESAAVQSQKLRRRKRLKLVAIVVLVLILQAIVFEVVDLTLLKVRRPNYRLTKINIGNVVVNNSTNSPSFLLDLDAEITFRNRNFGPYAFEFGYLTFSYMGARVGEAVVERSSVKMYSSKSVNLKVNVTSASVKEKSKLRGDIVGDRLKFKVESELRGQVKRMNILVKDRAVNLDCSFSIHLANISVEDLGCS